MPQTLYHFRGDESEFNQSDFRNSVRSESPAGNIAVTSKSETELGLELAIDHPITLTHFFSHNASEVHWRRTAEIIRTRGGGFYLFRFVMAGTVRVVTSKDTFTLEEGHFSITRGDVPYLTKSLPNPGGDHESFQVYVPVHRIAHRLPQEGFTGSFSCSTPTGATADALLRTLFQQGEHIDLALREQLVDALIEALIQCVYQERDVQPRRWRISNTRLSAIIQFIHDNATHSELDASTVAKKCGISRRYMSSLLAREGVQFKGLLRDVRLARAEGLLASPDAPDRTVAEVASLSGFHSAAYFSRVFKSTRGISPRHFRAERHSPAIRRQVADEVVSWAYGDQSLSGRHGRDEQHIMPPEPGQMSDELGMNVPTQEELS